MRYLTPCLLLALYAGNGMASVPQCRDMDEKTYEKVLPRAIEFFIKSNKFPLGRVDMSPGQDCGKKLYIEFEAKPEFDNPGYHWEIEFDKGSGAMTVVDGI